MAKTIFLICNAHLDPVWQWEWEEGAAETLSTFRVAAQLCEETDGFVFNHNESLLYAWVEQYEPQLFERIRALVRRGKWHIMGGWHVQPDCNMPSGEAFVRQILRGRVYFREKFGVEPTTAVNLDPFGHSRGLVQILQKSGFDSYLFQRPGQEDCPLPDDLFTWVGYDGSTVAACRIHGYNSALGKAAQKIRRHVEDCPENGFAVCLWGVGDHGGGPSRQDLRDIGALQTELGDAVTLRHATPEAYFAAVRESGQTLPRHAGDLNLWAPGCYTSMIRIKQQYRALENACFLTEQMASAAHLQTGMAYPKAALDEAMYDLLTVQFHDMLPGTVIEPAEQSTLRMLSHGAEILSRIRAQAFFALSGGQKAASADAIPILIYNPYPYPVEDDFVCEMMLWDQNWAEEFSMPQVYADGTPLPTQCEKESSNLPLDWRKRVVFHAVLAPMQMNRFDCAYTRLPQMPQPHTREDDEAFYLENARVTARIGKRSGALESYIADGREMLSAPCLLHVVRDDSDPWGMCVSSFPDRTDAFRPLTATDAAEWCGVSAPLDAVRCIESGSVRTTLEALLGFGTSRAVARYTLSAADTALQIELRIHWNETEKMLKFGVPTALENTRCMGEVAYGEEAFAQNGRENCAQKYLRMENSDAAFAVCTDSVYGSSAEDGALYLTLLRSAAYCAHPILDRDRIPQDRFTPHMEQGVRTFRFALRAGNAETIRMRTPRDAQLWNAPPMALSFYPPQGGTHSGAPFTLTGDPVTQTAFKKAEDGDGYILRLFNPFDRPANVRLTASAWKTQTDLTLAPFDIRTLRLRHGSVTENDLMEKE